ncbi:MAG TPA: cellulase family glycosylhydrolase [Chryseosolibacter sp.]|nr:cellulase family glycosylhydrolase [Chryseosolibacter sp.]
MRKTARNQRSTARISAVAAFFVFAASLCIAQTPVSVNGALRVSGNRIVNKNNQVVSFSGASFFWSNTGWGGERFYNASVVSYFQNNWKASIVRASMGVEDSGGYLSDPSNKNKVKTVVDAAIAAGLYVIIDWHSHHAESYQQQAIDFFREMAQTYGTRENVIYEIYNEPLQISWSGTIKPYAQAVISAIRAVDPDNLIVVGTPTWSQDVDVAASDPISGTNIAYTLHFYAATHKASLRTKAATALSRGVALFVTEWGTCEASGSGFVDQVSTNEWVTFMKENGISNCNWSINDKAESASILKPGVNTTGSWTDADLTQSGLLVKGIVQNWSPGSPPSVSLTAPANGATFTAPATITVSASASDSDGTISSVSFYHGSTLIATDNTSPYSVSWSNVAAGSYSLTARATDNSGLTTTSAARSITVNGSGGANLALNKSVTVSSTESASYPGSLAVDGNGTTRWSSAFADPQWIYVDLGTTQSVNRVKITWEAAYGRDYLVQIGTSTTSWTTMKTVTGNTSLVNDHTGLSGSGRYVRIYGTARGTPYGYSIFELEVYGTGGSTPTNLLTNSGFESSLSPWTGNNCTITQDAAQKQSGSYGVRVSGRAASWAGPNQNIRTALASSGPGTYNLAAWMKKESGSGTGRVTVMIRYGGNSYYHSASGAFSSSGWTQISGSVNLNWTGTLEDAAFYLETASGDATNFFGDNCSITKSSGARMNTMIADGDTPEQDPEFLLDVFPNPGSGKFVVRLSSGWGDGSSIRLMNSNGSLLLHDGVKHSEYVLDITDKPSGLYIVRVSNGKRSVVQKVFKE